MDLAKSRRERLKKRVVANVVEVRLAIDEFAEAAVDVQGERQMLQRSATIAGEAPVARQIVVERSIPGLNVYSLFERGDRFFQTADALVTPAKGHRDVDVVGD